MVSDFRTTHATQPPPSLRLWPGVVIVALQWVSRFVVPMVAPDAMLFAVLAGVVGGVAVVVWWLFFSRAPWSERIGAVLVMIVALYATFLVAHPSVAGAMMGMMMPIFALPILSLALVVAAGAGRRLSTGPRRLLMVTALVLAAGSFTLLRTDGITSNADSDFHWRWTRTAEERLLADSSNAVHARAGGTVEPDPTSPTAGSGERTATVTADQAAAAVKGTTNWSSFRGPNRDSILRGTRIKTDWTATPPVELWRRPVGPGWSSFAVSDGLIYTQEQRGEDEIVACYTLSDGMPVWRHQDAARFWESNAGAGPRGTPTLHEGRVYTFGATGLVNALDARSGAAVWSRDAAADTGKKAPDWGFASSPLVVGDLVIVAATGTLIAYDLATGAPRWVGPSDDKSYSSPHLLEIDGVTQVLLMSGAGATSVTPADGKVLWQHAWPGFAIVQPAQIANGELLISTGDRIGARRIHVTYTQAKWSVSERWTSNRLKPYFNDFALHRGHAFGFDNGILACVDLEDGKARWKGGRYGRGQVILLADQDVLLVLSEQGELALVAARSDAFTEFARFPALEGKTWNHPVLTGDVLLVRNDREMVAFRLP